jgi:hypothetical protein
MNDPRCPHCGGALEAGRVWFHCAPCSLAFRPDQVATASACSGCGGRGVKTVALAEGGLERQCVGCGNVLPDVA